MQRLYEETHEIIAILYAEMMQAGMVWCRASEKTEHNVVNKDLRSENPIGREHEESNRVVRKALVERNVVPEKLPSAEDIKKVQSGVKAEGRKLSKQIKKLKRNRPKVS